MAATGDTRERSDTTPVRWDLALLGGFTLRRRTAPVDLPLAAQRVVAFLALQRREVLRGHVAQVLWMDATEDHAAGNLRTALWRIKQRGGELVSVSRDHLSIAADAVVDLHEAERLLRSRDVLRLPALMTSELAQDVLPDWSDDWIYMCRERFRQLRLRGLEALSRQLSAEGAHGEAIDAAEAAVAAEPLRETAHRVLMEAHLAEGNVSEAVREYRNYRRLLATELGIAPSPVLSELVPVRFR
jgi:DNA-binding SARP family transcriptional activator